MSAWQAIGVVTLSVTAGARLWLAFDPRTGHAQLVLGGARPDTI